MEHEATYKYPTYEEWHSHIPLPNADLATNGRHIFGACTLVIHVYLEKPTWIHWNGGEHPTLQAARVKITKK